MLLTAHLYEDFIDVKRIAIAPVFSFQPSSVETAKLDASEADSFSGYSHATLG